MAIPGWTKTGMSASNRTTMELKRNRIEKGR